ncbi:hypothetical protein KFE25_002853 [Diacronema lutheri]|uniref:Uncharacterized protein n=1 Tax=Diacronema lutheri TaxID=2081491 RepID=A0A8J6CBY6_DIALT|nr:hypothetical protein KFE25_002853 [Diacronema lutheri]
MYSDTLAVEDGEPMLGEIGAETAASTEPALQVHMPTRSVNSSDFELADTSPGAVAHNTIEDHCVTELPVQSAHVEAPAGGDDVSVLSSVAPALRTAFIGDSSVFHGEDLLHASRELPSLGLSVNTIVCGGRDDLDSLPCSRLRATDDGFNSESDVMSADDVEPAPPCDPPVPCDDDDIDKQSTEPCELGIDLDRAADLGPAAHYPEPIHAGEAASASTSACCTPPPCAQRLAPPGTPTLDNECDQGDGDAVAGASTSSPALDDADAASIAAEKAPSFGANTPEPLTPAIGRQSSSEFCESPRGQGAGQIVIPEGSPRSSRDERGPRRFEMDGLVSRLDEVHVERLCSLSTELDELFSGFAEMACKIEAAAPGLAGEAPNMADCSSLTDPVKIVDANVQIERALRLANEHAIVTAELRDAEMSVEHHRATLGAVHSALAAPSLALPPSLAVLPSASCTAHRSLHPLAPDPRVVIAISQTIVLILATALGRMHMLA